MFCAASVNPAESLFSSIICVAAETGFVELNSGGSGDICVSCAAARAVWNGAISWLTLSERCVQLLEACVRASAEATLGGMPRICNAKEEVSTIYWCEEMR